MPLSAYTVTGPVAPLTQSFAKRMVAKYVSGGVIVFDETNLRNRYTLMKKFVLTVQVQDTPSQGHQVEFYNKAGNRVSGGISDVDGKVTGVFASTDPVTAIVKDKAGGDSYNSLIRTDLLPVPFDVR